MFWCMLCVVVIVVVLYEFNFEFNFNEFNWLGDVSWVQLGKFVGVWWEMYLECLIWFSGLWYGVMIVNVKCYIDFVVWYGFCGVLVEGWNFGWDGYWVGSVFVFEYLKFMFDFDFVVVVVYVKVKGVKFVGYYEIGGNIVCYEVQMDVVYVFYE